MKKKISKTFAHHLNIALQDKFSKKITSAYLALQFNQLVEEDLSISRETARKWMNGEALPEIRRMKILLEWLKIDANGFLKLTTGDFEPDLQSELYLNNLIFMTRHLDAEGKKLVLYTAWSLQEPIRKSRQSFEEFYKSITRSLKT